MNVRFRLRKAAFWAAVAGVFLLSAEVTSRIDDRLRLDIPFAHAPDRERDLVVFENGLRRGRPYGRFEKWKLNSFGFRGPQHTARPQPGRTRILILGASEIFGLYESPDREFPRRLQERLAAWADCEVINAAIPGMSVHAMIRYWREWASKFQPQLVLVYPSPLFYLNFERAPAADVPHPPPSTPARLSLGDLLAQVRLIGRAKRSYRLPDCVRRWRDARTLTRLAKGRDPSWFLASAPDQNADWLLADLETLVRSIEANGAIPVLLTHAVRCQAPPTAADLAVLEQMRPFFARASATVLAEFEVLARDKIKLAARESGWRLIDVGGTVSGRPDLFADLVHFNDAGADAVAMEIARGLETLLPVARRDGS